MAEEDLSYEDLGRSFLIPQDAKTGWNPALTVLVVVLGIVLLFIIGNYALYLYAQKNLPPRKKKPVSKKKMKRERLRQGVAPPGE